MTFFQNVREVVRQHPIVLAWFAIFCVVAALNGTMGREIGGAWMALAFVSVAVLGAYGAGAAPHADGWKRTGWMAIVALQLTLGQWAGWQTLGINLSRGAGHLEVSATQHNSTADTLKAARDERAKIGTTRTLAAIDADLDLEKKKTSRNYPDGCGPKCTLFRQERGAAERAEKLDIQIPQLVTALSNSDTLKDGDAPWAVPQAFGSFVASWVTGRDIKATPDDVRFYFSIFLTALLEFFATCGPWLLDLHGAFQPPKPRSYPDLERMDFGPKRVTHQPLELPEHFRAALPLGMPQSAPEGAAYGPRGDDGLDHPSRVPAQMAAASAAPLVPQASNSNLHGAPMTVNLHVGSDGHMRDGQVRPALPAPTEQRLIESVTDSNVAALKAVPQRLETGAPFAPAAPDVPTDRSVLNALLDGLATFKAHNVLHQKGAWIDAAQMYQRYCEWAGERACSDAAFHTLFPAATGTPAHHLGGALHYADVILKRAPLALAQGG